MAYAGSGATAEELAVFKCSSEDAATALVSSLETRNQTRIEQYSSYNPAEVPKLESALIMSSGVYVVLCVATDVFGVASGRRERAGLINYKSAPEGRFIYGTECGSTTYSFKFVDFRLNSSCEICAAGI